MTPYADRRAMSRDDIIHLLEPVTVIIANMIDSLRQDATKAGYEPKVRL
jgi:hypothetical protein